MDEKMLCFELRIDIGEMVVDLANHQSVYEIKLTCPFQLQTTFIIFLLSAFVLLGDRATS